jgi:glycerol-3-phosphate dehydrogenase
MVVYILKNEGFKLKRNNNFNPYHKKRIVTRNLSNKEKNILIKKNPQFGEIICRCEHTTKGEVVNAIHSRIPALTIDAIKRRTRTGMGRCQSGFCLPKIAQIIAQETDIPIEEILKNEKESNLFIGKTKCLLEDKYDKN